MKKQYIDFFETYNEIYKLKTNFLNLNEAGDTLIQRLKNNI